MLYLNNLRNPKIDKNNYIVYCKSSSKAFEMFVSMTMLFSFYFINFVRMFTVGHFIYYYTILCLFITSILNTFYNRKKIRNYFIYYCNLLFNTSLVFIEIYLSYVSYLSTNTTIILNAILYILHYISYIYHYNSFIYRITVKLMSSIKIIIISYIICRN